MGGMGVPLGIPLSEVLALCRLHRVKGERRKSWVRWLCAMDAFYLKQVAEKIRRNGKAQDRDRQQRGKEGGV